MSLYFQRLLSWARTIPLFFRVLCISCVFVFQFSKTTFAATAALSTLSATASTAVINGAPKQMRIAADGSIYILGLSTTDFVKISSDGSTATTITYDSSLTSHSSADFVMNGSTLYIVVANGTTSAPVYRYDISGSTASLVSSVGTTATGATSVSLGTDDTVYNNRSTALKGYSADLSTNTSSSTLTATAARSMINSGGVLYYVSTTGALRKSTDFTSSTDSLIQNTSLTSPLGIFVSSDGTAYVANASNIKKISSSGTTLWTKSVTSLSAMTLSSSGRVHWVNTSGTVTVLSPINVVSSFSGTPHSTSIDLSWTHGTSDSDFSGVTIRRSTSTYPTSPTAGTAVTSNDTGSSYSDTGLSPGTTYYYTIFNKTSDGFYDGGTTFSTATTPAAPTLTASKPSLTANSVNLSWDVPTGTNTFRLTYTRDSGAETTISNTIPNSTTSYSDSGITDGSYVYKIYAIDTLTNESTAGTSSTITIDTTAPSTPTIDASKPAVNSNTINLSWDTPATTNTFQLMRSYNSGGNTTVSGSIPSSTTNLTESSLADGTYVYTIYASDSFGNQSNAGISSTITIDTTSPSAPSITASKPSLNSNTINLSWDTPSGTNTFRLTRNHDGAGETTINGAIPSSTTSYADTSLTDGTYVYKIYAIDSFSNTSSASTSATITIDATEPSAPTITGSKPSLNSNTINLSWDTPSGTNTFRLTRNHDGAGETTINGAIPSSTTSYADTSLTDGTYVYKIYAIDSFSNTSNAGTSSTLTIDTTPPLAPSDFTATASGQDIHLTWTNPISDFSTVTLRRSSEDYPETITSDDDIFQNLTDTAYSDENLDDGTYYYSLFAQDIYGNISTPATTSGTISTSLSSGGSSGESGSGGTGGAAEESGGSAGGESGSGGATSGATLEVTITPPESNVQVGAFAIFTMDIDNTSEADFTETTVTFTLPDNLEFVSAELIETEATALITDNAKFETMLDCIDDHEGNVTCTLGTIEAASHLSLNITTTVLEAGSLTLGADFSGADGAITTVEEVGGGTTTGTAIDERSTAGANAFGCQLNPHSTDSQKIYSVFWLGITSLMFLTIKRLKKFVSLLIFILIFSQLAHAETDRFSIVPSFASQKGDWITTPSTMTLHKHDWNFSQSTSYAYHPLELSLAGSRTSGIVDHLLVQQWSMGYGITDRFTVEASLPVVWWNRFTDPTSSVTSNKVQLGDLSIQTRYRFYDRDEDSFGLSITPFITFPTGSEDTFSGEHLPTGGARVILDKKWGDRVTLGLHAGSRFREKAVFHDYDSASQFLTGIAGSVDLGKGFTTKTEIISQTAFNDFYQNKANSPVQWMLGVDKDFNNGWSANIGPSLSLIRGSGTPIFGTYLGISYNGHVKTHESHTAISQSFELIFRKRSATLVPASKTSLNKIAAAYQKASAQKRLRIFIEGDAFGKKNNKLTAPLFRKRVSNIKSYLVQQGVRESSIIVRPHTQSSKNMNYRQMIVKVESD